MKEAKPKNDFYKGYKIITYKNRDDIYGSYIFADGKLKAIMKIIDKKRCMAIHRAKLAIDNGCTGSFGIIL